MRARHVVVPLVVVAVAVLVFTRSRPGEGPVVDLASDVSECAANLKQIHDGLLVYAAREKHAPAESGVRFLGALIASGVLEDTPENRGRLSCPGRNAERVRAGVDYRQTAALTGADSAYAARDCGAFPLVKFPSGGPDLEPLVACDNARGLNHEGCMNVLYSDGSVRTLSLADEIANGRLPAGTTTIPVGKDSPVPDLRKLTSN